jgi:hypothetical protein
MKGANFGERALNFYRSLEAPRNLPRGIQIMNPYRDASVWSYVEQFCARYFADNVPRTLVFGINAGRFGGGRTGVMFTDPVALESICGIPNDLAKRREISSEFIYDFIGQRGGPQRFYSEFFLTAVSPLGFVRDGLNFNYYDDRVLLARIRPFVVRTLNFQLALGACRGTAIVLGSGANRRFLTALNHEHGLFRSILALDHPRFIMQYRRKQLAHYRREYSRTFAAARLACRQSTCTNAACVSVHSGEPDTGR